MNVRTNEKRRNKNIWKTLLSTSWLFFIIIPCFLLSWLPSQKLKKKYFLKLFFYSNRFYQHWWDNINNNNTTTTTAHSACSQSGSNYWHMKYVISCQLKRWLLCFWFYPSCMASSHTLTHTHTHTHTHKHTLTLSFTLIKTCILSINVYALWNEFLKFVKNTKERWKEKY